jgi:hypothetical protein
MDPSDSFFATTGAELDIRDAVLALERVLDQGDLDIPARITLQAALATLRELESCPAPSREDLLGDPLRRHH